MQGMDFGIKALVAAGAKEVGTYQGLPTFKVARTEDGSLADPVALSAYLQQIHTFGKRPVGYTRKSTCTVKPGMPQGCRGSDVMRHINKY